MKECKKWYNNKNRGCKSNTCSHINSLVDINNKEMYYTPIGILKEGGAEMEYTQEMKNRLKRIEGQVRGVLRMLEEEQDCKAVITQLSASRTAIDRTIGLIVGTNLEQCLREQMESGEEMNSDIVKEAVQLLVKSR